MGQAAGAYEQEGVTTFGKQSLIPMAKDKSSNPCNYYLFGKQHRVSFQKNSTQKIEKLELVYSDVCGLIEVDLLGGNKYFLLALTMLHKRHGYTYYIQKVRYQYFQKFHAMVGKEMGNPLKRLRTDNSREYISKEFKEYCSKHGIRHEKMIPGTPQHNGVAKKVNWTIVEKV